MNEDVRREIADLNAAMQLMREALARTGRDLAFAFWAISAEMRTAFGGLRRTAPENRHQRRQDASSRYRAACRHGAGEQRALAVSRREGVRFGTPDWYGDVRRVEPIASHGQDQVVSQTFPVQRNLAVSRETLFYRVRPTHRSPESIEGRSELRVSDVL